MTMSTRFRWMTTAVLALLFSVTANAFAQNATITGKVISDGGQPLYGANVVIDALTISVGTICMTPASGAVKLLFRRTDELLYRAKENGRNRVEFL